MTRKECFDILELSERANLSDIKRSYRRLAFALHPDLNPGVKDAAKRFQRLNEAYVLLSQDQSEKAEKRAQAQSKTAEDQEEKRTRQEAGKAYSKAKERFDKDQKEHGGSSGQYGNGGHSSQSGPGDSCNSGASNSSSASNSDTSSGYSTNVAGSGYKKPTTAGKDSKGREDVLKDILDDAFARRVFEDIYSHLQHGSKNTKQTDPKISKPVKERSLKPSKAKNKVAPGLASSLAGGMIGGVKGWFKRQIDEDQTMAMPGEFLIPGARVRIKVRHGIAGRLQTVELTLPPEFVPGKPVRLKGLGKHLGSLRGDLYLTLIPRD